MVHMTIKVALRICANKGRADLTPRLEICNIILELPTAWNIDWEETDMIQRENAILHRLDYS